MPAYQHLPCSKHAIEPAKGLSRQDKSRRPARLGKPSRLEIERADLAAPPQERAKRSVELGWRPPDPPPKARGGPWAMGVRKVRVARSRIGDRASSRRVEGCKGEGRGAPWRSRGCQT